jgi:uncharacterized membrane protein YsdA (DUF1294 family)
LVELALLCQSRGSVVALPVTAAVYLVLVPGRSRALVAALPPAIAVLLTHRALLHVFPALRDGVGVSGAVGDARNAVLISAFGGLAAGVAIATADRYVAAPDLRRIGERVVVAGALLAVAVGIVVALAGFRHPEQRVERAWAAFKDTQPATRKSYFANGLGGNRYDAWRVALLEFRSAPLAGQGVDNFAADYLRSRRSLEEPTYPHSIELRLLSQTGLIGAALFLAFIAALAVVLRRMRQLPASRRAVAGTAVAMATYWFVHGSGDWFWEIPALGGLAFACLGIAVSVVSPVRGTTLPRRYRAAALEAVAVVALGIGVSFFFPWLAAQETVSAALSWRDNPATAYARLDTASRLNPLSDRPKLVEGAIASRLGDRTRMKQAFTEALRRNPQDWYAHLELAVVAVQEGRAADAREQLAVARRLDPREPAIERVDVAIRTGKPLHASELDRLFLARTKL